MKSKHFDAVGFMRKVRDELSKKYVEDPQAQERDLERIRKKYGITRRKRVVANKRMKATSIHNP
jgi:hypothetical protein